MTAKLRDSPDANRIKRKAASFLKPACGFVIVLLFLVMLFISQEHKSEIIQRRISSPVVTQPNRRSVKQSAGELIPVLTGGAGGSTSLGGNSSLGGTARH